MTRSTADTPAFSVVVPTVGRPSLDALLESLAAATGPRPAEVIVVYDRPTARRRTDVPGMRDGTDVRVLRTGGSRGPAGARNVGWRAALTDWVAFLDDDVLVGAGWYQDLTDDLAGLPADAAASQGRIRVPLPGGRRPTDWERNVAGLEQACWATADMAYRRDVLREVGGFDERFRRAYREDSDLALRVQKAGWLVLRGEREVTHPVRAVDRWISVRLQTGNADDMTMRALHGPDWRTLVGAGPGRTGRHLAVTTALGLALLGPVSGRRRAGVAAMLGWLTGTAEFLWVRIAPGPRTADEVATMAVTSVLIPPVATYQMAVGWLRSRRWAVEEADRPLVAAQVGKPTIRSRVLHGPVPKPVAADPYWSPKAVLFDRDGTLIVDRHYLAEPEGVVPMPGARRAVERVRSAGLAAAVVTNQSGVGRGLISREQMESVNRRVDDTLGPFDWWAVCCHAPAERCSCRKPAAGLVLEAADRLGVSPRDCAVIGDIAADVEAAAAAGARAVLVPTRRTRITEIRAAAQVAPDLLTAVDLVLAGRC